MKVRLFIKKTAQVSTYEETQQIAMQSKKEQRKASRELKKRSDTDLVQHDKQLDGEKQGTQQSHNTTMGSRKRMSLNVSTKRVQVAPPREKQLISDSSFKKQLEGDKQLQKQTHKNFKKRRPDRVQHQKLGDTEKKREGDQKTPIQSRNGIMINDKAMHQWLTKSMSPPLKMNKQSNCSSITRPMQKTTQSSAVARPMQKETQSISHTKKFESSKRKFEERLAEQREAKRRIVMVDFRDMPKPVNDPRAPRCCWDRRRF
ncbi:hypothetical protein HAX54_029726 [Datura stramonium]|uniref:Uncharacterized protein n=1 Tax=Datura stramonium TaxID=4076 RepID=A0ABS8RKW6_DATST|nr:hypothetical protein [Datura stramonium]